MGSFEALRFIEAEEKRKNKAEKGKRREKLEKRKTNLQPQFVGCKIGAFFTIKLGKKCQKWSISAHEMRCGPYIYNHNHGQLTSTTIMTSSDNEDKGDEENDGMTKDVPSEHAD